ncbi:MAG: TIGR01212 family radical SAM protein, partial [Candidatus Omnitrophica bacterium]|nr:TIGR01212 family radical SAM protein [Candidatus Omnitrophota bacterium]
PNLDGSLSLVGCSFCNNKAFSLYARTDKPLRQQIEDSIKFYSKRLGAKKFVAYFQSFSSTYAPVEELKKAYDVITEYSEIVGLSISTRPDCIDREKLELISTYKEKYLLWLEYGLQTTDDVLLKRVNRNHSYCDFLNALDITRDLKINTAVHAIIGLPGQGHDAVIRDALNLSRLDIQGIKFHVLHVLKGTTLNDEYLQGKVDLLTADKYVTEICDYLELLPKTLVIMRLVSTAFPDYLVAPLWINDRAQLIEKIKEEFRRRGSCQGSLYKK